MNEKNKDTDRFPGVDPIPDPDHERPSATDMFEEVLEEGSLELKRDKEKHRANASSTGPDSE